MEIINDADYADDLALHANTPAQSKSLLHNLEQVARGIGLSVDSDKCVSIKIVLWPSG